MFKNLKKLSSFIGVAIISCYILPSQVKASPSENNLNPPNIKIQHQIAKKKSEKRILTDDTIARLANNYIKLMNKKLDDQKKYNEISVNRWNRVSRKFFELDMSNLDFDK